MPQPDTADAEQTPALPVLPPFSGEETTCAKCSNFEARTTYRPAIAYKLMEFNGRMVPRGPLPERLERECRQCDYTWDEALHPAPGVRPTTVAELAWALSWSHRGWALDLPPELAEHMAQQLMELTHVMIRADHPAWQPAGLIPLLAIPDGLIESNLAHAVPITLANEPTTDTTTAGATTWRTKR
ncbi:hypothetical protein [Streptomyces sp. NPDC058548]|uniref:hypothetical protein n=1 Tax=Streptomyces sp. NPDC058548 TaxID=3346545 RepID=UPI003652D49E